jgi:uncharacterized membrane protein
VTDSPTRDRAIGAATLALAAAVAVSAVRAARRRRRSWIAAGRYEYRALTETTVLPVLREHLYWLLREPTRVARLVDPDAEVEPLGDTRSRWTLAGPDGTQVSCLVEVIGDVPEMQISWLVPDGPLPHEGRIELTPVPPDTDLPTVTEVRVRVRYAWSDRLARAAGIGAEEPARVLRRALRALATASAQPRR